MFLSSLGNNLLASIAHEAGIESDAGGTAVWAWISPTADAGTACHCLIAQYLALSFDGCSTLRRSRGPSGDIYGLRFELMPVAATMRMGFLNDHAHG